MANEIRRIFKDEMIGEPRIQKVLRNRIQGVSGELIDITPVPRDNSNEPNILTSQQKFDDYIFTKHTFDEKPLFDPSGLVRVGGIREATSLFKFDYSLDFRFNYSTPIKNAGISVRLYYDEYRLQSEGTVYSGSDLYNKAMAVYNWIGDKENIFTQSQRLDTDTTIQNFNIVPTPKVIDDEFVVNTNIKPFSVEFSSELNKTLDGKYKVHIERVSGQSHYMILDVFFIQPKYIEVIVRGDTVRETPQAFHIGSTENVFQFPKNSLLTTKSTYSYPDGTEVPLHQYLANKIIEEWHDGKQVTTLTKVINNNSDIINVGESVILINARQSDYIPDDSQSYSKNKDGTPKVFVVDGWEMYYDGTLRQDIDISEKTQ